ncbi:MAG: hypothetical protein JW914_03160 [Syntrophaceae bacterium]|nr:hypothetical protein [Syntrophaceae bacterium]
MKIFLRFKIYTIAMVSIGLAFAAWGIYDLFNLQNWECEGFYSKNAKKILSFFSILVGLFLSSYFFFYFKIPNNQINDFELVPKVKQKEKHFLIHIIILFFMFFIWRLCNL